MPQLVNVVNMVVLDNPTSFGNPFQFEITFECLQELEDDLEWKVVYVGSATDMNRDQVLDEILVGPVPVGVNKFVLQADAPDPAAISNDEILGVTVVLVTCSYKEREFIRIGYYVNNEYADPIDEEAGTPNPLDLKKVVRTILADKPRVTRFAIPWDGEEAKDEGLSAAQGDVVMEETEGFGVAGGTGDDDQMEEDEEEDDEEEEEEEDGDEEIDL